MYPHACGQSLLEKTRAGVGRAHSAAMKNAEIPSARPESVLVVDDDVQCRRLIIRMLRELGYRTTHEARSAAEALLFLSHTSPTIVLTDIVMERHDAGLAVVARARAAGIPVAFVSGAPSWSKDAELCSVPGVLKEELSLASLAKLLADLIASRGTP